MIDENIIDPWADEADSIIDIDNLLAGLNPEQRKAVTTTEGPLLIQAGAGSGKTKTLIHRIAYIIATNRATPYNILAVTFTNKAAKEMRQRIAELLHEDADNRSFMPFMGTFHSICVRLLRQDGERIGVPRNFVIFDESDKVSAVKQAIRQLSIDDKSFTPKTISNIISSTKNDLVDAAEFASFANSPTEEVVAKVMPIYENSLKQAGALDFDDLISKTVRLLMDNPDVRERWQSQFKYIMIDEYQDTNQAQYRLVKLLVGKTHNVAVVGDDWQCLPPGTLIETDKDLIPIEKLKKGDVVRAAAGYGVSGLFSISAVRKFKHKDKMVVITTESGKQISSTSNHLIFARLEENNSYYVYLMYSPTKGYRLGMAKDSRFNDKVFDVGLRVGANQEQAAKVWILKVCSNKEEASYFESLLAYKYGIPMTLFHAFSNGNMKFSQEHVDSIFSQIDTRERAGKLMADLDVMFEYPHFVPQATASKSVVGTSINVVLFGDKKVTGRSSCSASRLSINTSNEDQLIGLKEAGYTIRQGKSDTDRLELHNLDYGYIEQKLEELKDYLGDETVVTKYSYMTDKKFLFMPASQIHPGMSIATYSEGVVVSDKVKEVKQEEYEGYVYDLDIEKVHNYIASGVVVHNSIYSWRGADFKNILNFEQDYKKATIIKLEQNYRSTKSILDAAHSVITKNQHRSDKQLWTDEGSGLPVQILQAPNQNAEGEMVIRRIESMVKAGRRRYKDYAILYRTNAQSRSVEEMFVRFGVPYKIIGGVRFYDRKEVKDVVAYLRFIFQPEDAISFERIVNVPTRGIGAKSLEAFRIWSASSGGILKGLETISDCSGMTPKAKNGFRELADIVISYREIMEDTAVSGLIDSLLRRLDYMNYLDDGTIQGESRQENVRELISVAKSYQDVGLEGFLEEVSLVSEVINAGVDDNSVTLMTLHSAKGLEFPAVFMVGLEETIMPHSRALYDQHEMEEERRLMYVGMTRAREELYLFYATSRALFGGVQYNPPSRFLSEIEPGITSVTTEPETGYGRQEISIDEPRYVIEFNQGDKVSHQAFGEGVVVDVDGDNVAVHFKSKGVKKLNTAFAPLEKLS